MTSPLKIVFAGTPAFGIPSLDLLNHSKHILKAVYTQPDRPAGRGQGMQSSAVKTWALAHQIPIVQPLHFKDSDTLETLKALKPDVLVVIAYGLILPESVLQIPRFGAINVHASLLPRWRGASPIQHAILYGDSQTGVSIMQMDKGMDTGAVFTEVGCPIDKGETALSLHDKLAQLAPKPLLDILNTLIDTPITPSPQDDTAVTYAPKILKTDAKINWQQTATEIDRKIRAFTPWPIAFTHMGETLIRIHEAIPVLTKSTASPGTVLKALPSGLYVACKENILCIKKIQFPGGKMVTIQDCLNSNRLNQIVDQILS